MDTFTTHTVATALILLSALLHAIVNTLIKVSGDGLITRGCMNAVACFVAAPLLLAVPAPGPDLWPILIASVLVHALYPFFLVEAYRAGDLSTGFPLARGSVPLLVALLAYLALGQIPGGVALAGIVIASLSVASFAFGPAAARGPMRTRGVVFALATGSIIAIYTVIDASGLRTAASPLAYIAWLFVLDGACVAVLVSAIRARAVVPYVRRNWRSALLAGALGTLTYGLALFALALGPVAEIAALRESSIVFAALIGTFVLREPLGRARVAAALAMLGGIVLMHVRG